MFLSSPPHICGKKPSQFDLRIIFQGRVETQPPKTIKNFYPIPFNCFGGGGFTTPPGHGVRFNNGKRSPLPASGSVTGSGHRSLHEDGDPTDFWDSTNQANLPKHVNLFVYIVGTGFWYKYMLIILLGGFFGTLWDATLTLTCKTMSIHFEGVGEMIKLTLGSPKLHRCFNDKKLIQ